MTALSLEKPAPSSEIEARLMKPIVDRLWNGCPYCKAPGENKAYKEALVAVNVFGSV